LSRTGTESTRRSLRNGYSPLRPTRDLGGDADYRQLHAIASRMSPASRIDVEIMFRIGAKREKKKNPEASTRGKCSVRAAPYREGGHARFSLRPSDGREPQLRMNVVLDLRRHRRALIQKGRSADGKWQSAPISFQNAKPSVLHPANARARGREGQVSAFRAMRDASSIGKRAEEKGRRSTRSKTASDFHP